MGTLALSETSTSQKECQSKVVVFKQGKKGKRPEGAKASPQWHHDIGLAIDLLGLKFLSGKINLENISLSTIFGYMIPERRQSPVKKQTSSATIVAPGMAPTTLIT
jgi:hypothetical protein